MGPRGQPQRGTIARPQQIAQRPDFDMAPEPVRAARAFLVEMFGPPEKAVSVGATTPPGGKASPLKSLEIGLFGAAPAPHVLATAGASVLACPDGGRREWLFILKAKPAEHVVGLLANVAAAAAPLGEVLDTDELKPFSALLLLSARALPPDKRSFTRKDGTTVELGWVIPVFAEEARFIRQHGPESLFLHWEAARPDLTSLTRKPSVPAS